MKFISRLIALAMLLPTIAFAQSSPNLSYGQVPTAGQWNGYFASKQDYLGYTPLNQAGGTMLGKLTTAASTTQSAGFSFLQGVAPASPNNGDIWLTSTGLYYQAGNITFGPIGAGTITGPATTAVGNIAKWGNTSGTALIDGGALGTAAGQNTGTSGPNVPLLNGTNTWSAPQSFSSVTVGGVTQVFPTSGNIVGGPATSNVGDLACWANGTGSLLTGCQYLNGLPNAVSRTITSRLQDVKDAGDWGVSTANADNSTQLNQAISDISAAGGGTLRLPNGVVFAQNVVIKNGVYLRGGGMNTTFIKQKNGANASTVIADGNGSLFGTIPANPIGQGTHDFGLFDLTIDGNMANNTTTAGNSCFSFWGYREIIQNVGIDNCPGTAWKSEWTDANTAMEGYVNNLTIDTCSYDGMDFGGPHDSRHSNIIVKDCGRAASNTYSGVRTYGAAGGANSFAEWSNLHPWVSTLPAAGYKYALFVDTGGTGNFIQSQFEGAISNAVRLQGYAGGTVINDSMIFAIATGPLISICSAQNLITNVNLSNTLQASPVGVVFDNSGACNPSSNTISMVENNLTGGAINFAQSGGLNQVSVRGYQSSGSAVLGTYFSELLLDSAVAPLGNIYFSNGVTLSNSTQKPAVASGFCTSPTINGNNVAGFILGVGTGCSTGTGTITLPAAPTVWQCAASDLATSGAYTVKQTAFSTTSATFANFAQSTGAAANFNSSSFIEISCRAY
ncbi:hypothetical protein RHSP_82554 [Rhizobium freirei PRF 81]|uniref:Pectate lyase superfamily protein domain-containing protein n=1 Tax=Rhizobium freirei PRF 81 TaxID=363754 RepID=N6U776_9HYPH|nr:hypothetical protein [Rhizobium freirei]ENN86088.1 hypothetical protein RHSP_82554 [Rhizobium freirei PRF 81]